MLNDFRLSWSTSLEYAHGGGASDVLLLETTKDGFEVFYDERGRHELLAKFTDEADACTFFLA